MGGVALAASPALQVHREVAIRPDDAQRGAGRERAQGTVDEEVRAPVEAEIVKVDSRVR